MNLGQSNIRCLKESSSCWQEGQVVEFEIPTLNLNDAKERECPERSLEVEVVMNLMCLGNWGLKGGGRNCFRWEARGDDRNLACKGRRALAFILKSNCYLGSIELIVVAHAQDG